MQAYRRKTRLAGIFLASLLTGLTPLAAISAPQKNVADKTPAASACSGTDMLRELSDTDTGRHQQLMEQIRAAKNADAVLWKITRSGTPDSYLFGTVHLTDERVSILSENVTKALKKSSALALEVADLTPNAMAQAIARAAKLAIFSDERNLKTILSPEDYAKVERKLKSSGMPVQTAKVFRPWVISMLLATSDCERKNVRNGKEILDAKLASAAKKYDLQVVGLETLDGQLEAMASIPMDDQLAILRGGLAYVERSNDLVETLIQFYLNRQIGGTWPFQLMLAEKAGVSADAYDSFRRTIIIERNQKMRDAALPLLEKGGAFVAVGALHLPGDDGLVAMLRRAGFEVTAIE